MLWQKIIMALEMIYGAFFIASVIKFAAQKRITPVTLIISIFMPVLILYFLLDFSIFIYKQKLKELSFGKKMSALFKLLKFEVISIPLVHTMLITIAFVPVKEKNEDKFSKSAISFSMKTMRQTLTPYTGI